MKRHRIVIFVILGILLCIGVAYVLKVLSDSNAGKVPVGIENAVVIRYDGPRLAVKPFKQGVSVDMRIASVVERDGVCTYDLRYILNEASNFDLRDFLESESGEDLVGLPPILVTGLSVGDVKIEDSLSAFDPVEIEIGHHYYEILTVMFVLWVAWLMLLVFYRRPHQQRQIIENQARPTFAELLRPYREKIVVGELSAEERMELEQILFEYWSRMTSFAENNKFEVLRTIADSERYGADYDTLELWLHGRTGAGKSAVGAMLDVYCSAAEAGEVAA